MNHTPLPRGIPSSRSCLGGLAILLALGLGLIAETSPCLADRIELLEGPVLDAQVIGIDEQGRLQLSGSQTDLGWSDVHAIDRRLETSPPARPRAVVFLHNRSRLCADRVHVDQGQCVLIGSLLGQQTAIPLDQVRGLLLHVPENWPATSALDQGFFSTLSRSEQDAIDQLWVRTDSGLQRIQGTLETIDDRQVRLLWNQQVRGVNLARVYGLVLAAAHPGAPTIVDAAIHLIDGSILWGRLSGLRENTLQVSLGNRRLGVTWDTVRKIEAIGPRLVYLSDLEPVAVVQEYFPSAGWSWQRDRAVTGEPMSLGGKIYARGLGVHAHCELEYDLRGEFAWFMATIGLQPPGPLVGDCEFVLRGDGRELFRRRMRASDPPQPIRLSVQGVRRLILAVEPGENFDIGDHANWAEARLLRAASGAAERSP